MSQEQKQNGVARAAPARQKHAKGSSLATASAETRRLNSEVARLTHRNDVLNEALSISQETSQSIADSGHREEMRRNTADDEREKVMSELRSTQATLLRKIDTDKTDLAISTARLREMSTMLILAHEEEQRRIGAELHDEIGQELTALRIVLGRARRAPQAEARQLVTEAEGLVGILLETTRTICRSLRPQALDDLGLVKGLDWHLRTIGDRTGLKIELDAREIDEKRLSPIIASAIFRVTQEAITNVLRHAKAKQARVEIMMTVSALEFSVRDDGRGFDTAKILPHASTGLSSMMERVSLVNGQCRVESKPKKGTCVRVVIPLREAGGERGSTVTLRR